MVDKPHGLSEELLDRFFKWYAQKKEQFQAWISTRKVIENEFCLKHSQLYIFIKCAVIVLLVGLYFLWAFFPRTVTVAWDDSLKITYTEYKTSNQRVETFLKANNLEFNPNYDIMDAKLYERPKQGMTISIKKAPTIPVSHDGITESVTTQPIKVGELLTKMGIEYDGDDIVKPGIDHVLKKGDTLTINRVEVKHIIEQESDPYTSEYVKDSSLVIGKTKVAKEGKNGLVENTYMVMIIDGKQVSKTLYSSKVIQEKQNRIIKWGSKIAFGDKPSESYSKVLNCKAVAYHFNGNPHGAYGLACTHGTIAVDKRVIPLGTRVYVEGYGYAIANDVGSGVKGNVVDLYMEYGDQPYIYGAHRVKVYILN